MTSGTSLRTIRLWDWPVRLTHWSFVMLLPAMWWTGENGDLSRHILLGEVFLGLVVFRVLWGLVGSQTARFSAFLKGPRGVLSYIRGIPGPKRPGHNPIGGWSVVAMLALLAVQIGLGLIAQDIDALESGPLSHLVSYETSDAAREWHHLLFNGILVLVALHICAILFYLFVKRDNLVRPMVSGDKVVDDEIDQPRPGSAITAATSMVIAAGLAWWVALGAPTG